MWKIPTSSYKDISKHTELLEYFVLIQENPNTLPQLLYLLRSAGSFEVTIKQRCSSVEQLCALIQLEKAAS